MTAYSTAYEPEEPLLLRWTRKIGAQTATVLRSPYAQMTGLPRCHLGESIDPPIAYFEPAESVSRLLMHGIQRWSRNRSRRREAVPYVIDDVALCAKVPGGII